MVANADETPRDALLLDPSTRVTCPKCEHEFSLEEGFAKKSLEAIARPATGRWRAPGRGACVEEKRAPGAGSAGGGLLREQLKNQQDSRWTHSASRMRTRSNRCAPWRKTRPQARERGVAGRLDEQSCEAGGWRGARGAR